MTQARTAPTVRQVRFLESWEAWRLAARGLLAAGIPPERAIWSPEAPDGAGEPVLELFRAGDPPAAAPGEGPPRDAPRVPRAFLALGEAVACHRDPERWALLYRALWRLAHGEPHLLQVDVDPDVRRLLAMERASAGPRTR